MGDCRVRIQIAKELVAVTASTTLNDANGDWCTISKVWSADTTIREVAQGIRLTDAPFDLLALLTQKQASLWDCTSHPPKDISDWPIDSFKETQGSKSKTLFDAGWFPSGSLQVVSFGKGALSASVSHYEDSQYNLPSESLQQHDSKQRVQLMGAGSGAGSLALPAPSQVLHAVTQRFDGNEAETAVDQAAVQIRRQNQKSVVLKQTDRFRKLEERIRKLQETSGKNKAVSTQVRNMLIKSRATGRSDLKMQDRVYLHCMVDTGGSFSEDYRYFSRQDAVGRVLSAFAVAGMETELLIRRETAESTDEAPVYRRLSILMRLYEAISCKYLADIDTVVIRLYNPAQEDATPCVEDEEEAVDAMDIDAADVTTAETQSGMQVEPAQGIPMFDVSIETTDDSHLVTNPRVDKAIRDMDAKDSKKKKKASAAALKVKQMQMKSRAVGAAKRVKMEQRFFVELVTVVDDPSAAACTATLAPVFVGQTDNFERLVRDCSKAPSKASWEWELLVSCISSGSDTYSYRLVAETTMSLQEAQQNGVLAPFDRLVLRYFLP